MISVVIPTLNAAKTLPLTLAALAPAAMDGLVRELIIVDGGSNDDTALLADEAGARFEQAEAGRGGQLRYGCDLAKGPWLLILHADTRLSVDWEVEAMRHMRQNPDRAAYFRFQLDDPRLIARVWEAGVAMRCALMGLPYGDQGLLISKAVYEAVGGYAALALMEDVDLVRRLGRKRLVGLRARALTNADRFKAKGYWHRSLRNWGLLLRFLFGTDPKTLAKAYD
jgi:rSAM/selenodomain-associated transferase 2